MTNAQSRHKCCWVKAKQGHLGLSSFDFVVGCCCCCWAGCPKRHEGPEFMEHPVVVVVLGTRTHVNTTISLLFSNLEAASSSSSSAAAS
jgi:hypothetical protein